MKFVMFTFDMQGASIAYKMQKEGYEVMVGVIRDNKEIAVKEELQTLRPEEPEYREKRLSLYDGLLEKQSARTLLELLQRQKDKKDWYVFCDTNLTFKYGEALLNSGFDGNFPTEYDRTLEVSRARAKEFVSENYPGIHVAEYQEFKKVVEGIEFLKKAEKSFVLKSEGDVGDTLVPPDDVELAKEQVIDQLNRDKKEYEQMGFTLEEKITEPKELTTQIVFYDGLPVYTILDIENKPIFAGNKGLSMGCMQNLVLQTDMENPLNKLSFPSIIYEMAKQRKGLFIWDISLLFDKQGIPNFGEFCANRFGWDCMPTEIAMAEKTSLYFEKIKNQEYPLKYIFGAGVRILNIEKNRNKWPENIKIEWDENAEPDIYVYDAQLKDNNWVTTGYQWDQAVITGIGDNIRQAVDKAYEYVDMYHFVDMGYRPKFDFLSKDYPTSIINRYNYAKENKLI